MPKSIIPLLAERLDISEEQVQPLLSTMVEELRQRAESDGVQLSGLGTFREEDGTLAFRPAPTLRRRVNRPYEGLSAESLSPATEREASPAQGTPEKATNSEPSSAPAADPEAPSTQDRSPARPDANDRSVDSFVLISLILAGLFLLGAGWFVINQTNLWGPTQDAAPPTATETPPDQAESPSTTGSASDPPPDAPPSADTEASDTRDWTIVVASSSSRGSAQEAADTYGSQFDSVAVVSGTVDDATWYRVTIGRYPSESAAERVLDERTEALPPDAWTHQLE
ncbi:SPOR domain-containing protein [Salinibacter altiplanensis]|uniref:SPOR domain-containing protein n=1 Tax=Salinibacter altiplanensis TaxID=1803181 RepID=UPI000C9F61B7|nr:SPOR domain-containing protein [Salinibacter altiplanensis]